MIFVFDLDGTLCETQGTDYLNADPIPARIRYVRQLHDMGHQIVIDTARGTLSGIDWTDLTRTQLETWGVPFAELRVGKKPYGDVYVDDKGFRADEFFSCAS